ncbi:uncharacterized protein [Antedon mediterranea]|uniref:uncharacterized protein n=1 Tax=Antedon mediterranea TaxID=105859 RepID=UPI003AF9DC85
MLKVVILMLTFIHGSYATCCCSESASVFPRVELTNEQKQQLINLANFLESLPCDQRMNRTYNMTQPPIQLSDSQMVGLAQRYGGSFQEASDVGPCQEPIIEQPRPSRKRRATDGTPVCRATVEDNKMLFVAYNKNGELVYIPQPTTGNGFQMAQFFYESVCLDAGCDGPACSCSTDLIPSSTCIVHVIQGNTNTFTQQTIMTRRCNAFT